MKTFVLLILWVVVAEGFVHKKRQMEEDEKQLHPSKRTHHHEQTEHKHARNVPSDCPQPGAPPVLQTEGKVDLSLMYANRTALSNLAFICGMHSIADGFQIHLDKHGKPHNQTKYRAVPLCCPGYVRNENDICMPKCKGDCNNGICVATNNCACYQGYTLNSLGNCVLTCPCGCPHGRCSGAKCSCDPGYALANDVCNPGCRKPCVNGECVGPDNCECHNGYHKKTEHSHVCEPHCTNGCDNGQCVSPDVCVCDTGYIKSKNTGRCEPSCAGCEHGNCLAPFLCQCHAGYVRLQDKCEPVCTTPCSGNSTCTGPDQCSCLTGYTRNTKNTRECVPHCVPECKHADCVAPNNCVCHEHFVPSGRKNECENVGFHLLQAFNRH